MSNRRDFALNFFSGFEQRKNEAALSRFLGLFFPAILSTHCATIRCPNPLRIAILNCVNRLRMLVPCRWKIVASGLIRAGTGSSGDRMPTCWRSSLASFCPSQPAMRDPTPFFAVFPGHKPPSASPGCLMRYMSWKSRRFLSGAQTGPTRIFLAGRKRLLLNSATQKAQDRPSLQRPKARAWYHLSLRGRGIDQERTRD